MLATCLSIRQPRFYIAGCLHGDAWIGKPSPLAKYGSLCLRVADVDFASAFSRAITMAFGITSKVGIDDRGYALVRKYNGFNRFKGIKNIVPKTDEEKAAWVLGMFDSEGNASLCKLKKSENCFSRRISFYSTDIDTLKTTEKYLNDLGIKTYKHATKNSKQHKGKKIVYALIVCSSKQNYTKFRDKISSNIARKRTIIQDIINSYCDDLSAARRDAQILGAKSNKMKTINTKFPYVVNEIYDMLKNEVHPSCKLCKKIKWYTTVEPYVKRTIMIKIAKEKFKCCSDKEYNCLLEKYTYLFKKTRGKRSSI